ncbi:MAG: phosphate acetyltransferase [Epulopiscium sp. Nele67-Bin005]|nr:MAG: phosphate acetyltransferase [Epulopiscium sp. Nele67-Bin005]
MSFLETIKAHAKNSIKTIALPEPEDIRTLEAAHIILQEGFANLILIGDEVEIAEMAQEANLDISKATVVNPKTFEHKEAYIEALVKLRERKGMTEGKAKKFLKDPVHLGIMMVQQGMADGVVAGAVHSTADVLRPSLQILKTKPGTQVASTFFIIDVPNCTSGHNGIFVFGDCGLNQNPTAEQLAQIAKSSANSFKQLVEAEPIVAMLSHSTYGSAEHPDVDKVVEATRIAKEIMPDVKVDGELQVDAAIVPDAAKAKAPNSPVAGDANVLIFPDLDSGNISYKLVQRLAKAGAYGPLTQGFAKPVNDLSRGCSAEDIVGVVAVTAVQAQQVD